MIQAYSAKILARVLKADEIKWLDEQYEKAKISSGVGRYRPTKPHIKIFNEFLAKKITVKEGMQRMGVKHAATLRQRFGSIALLIVKGEIEA